MKTIDLFCGSGGWITGLKEFHEIVLAVDIWDIALKTLSINHKDVPIIKADVLKLNQSDLPKHDLIIGSPPCQPFSLINRQTRTENLNLTKKFLKLAKNSLWIMENVAIIDKYKDDLQEYYKTITDGEKFDSDIIQMSDYGVPQIRKRFIASNFVVFPLKKGKIKEVSDFLPLKTADVGRIPKHSKKIVEKMKFYPEKHRQILLDWINSISIDWPVSRRRYYGTEIPIWYCKNCRKACLPKPEKYYRPWIEKPPFKNCPHCKSDKGFEGETRTFDTWMDSSVSPLFISRYQKDDNFFKKTYPSGIRPQAKDIIRTWLHYTILRCYQLTKEPAFERVWIMGYGVDEKGERMSKSKGNVVDPMPVLEKYGGDVFRMWNAAEASLGSDFRYSNDRVEGASKFLTKLWNVSRFISMFPQPAKVELTATDKWILSELNGIIKECLRGYESFDFFIPANAIREFTWNLFAPHYIEMAKPRAYGQGFNEKEQKAAWYTLHLVLKTLLKLFAPIAPYITDYVWGELYGKESIHLESLPKPEWSFGLEKFTEQITEFNANIWKMKKDKV